MKGILIMNAKCSIVFVSVSQTMPCRAIISCCDKFFTVRVNDNCKREFSLPLILIFKFASKG